jgi:hypothetical protein
MALDLPPKAILRCDQPTADRVHATLTSVIAGHPQATTTYRFYEEVDAWLGPWGPTGYPIGYGKFYNVQFTTNPHLQANPTTRQWVWRTGIALQEALRDYIVGRIRDGSLPSLTEAELREAAFDSHPAAYDRGGLAMVVLAAPELVPIVATIPAAEFVPTSRDFGPTVEQVFLTAARIAPQAAGGILAVAAGPAHNRMFRRAAAMDQRALMQDMSLGREIASVRRAIQRGDLDHVPLLDRLIASLNAREFPDQGFARAAREIVELATARRRILLGRLKQWSRESPEVGERMRRQFPGLVPDEG